jgi:hypothetical protein
MHHAKAERVTRPRMLSIHGRVTAAACFGNLRAALTQQHRRLQAMSAIATAKRKKIDSLAVAAKLGIHPASMPRLRKRPGFPQGWMLFQKWWWWEDEVDQYIEQQARSSQSKGAA